MSSVLAKDVVISVKGIEKVYASGFRALKPINLDIHRGEIFALLGPNGAGKTTLINIICGLVNASAGTVTADGFDIRKDYREARSRIGLVPQEITADMFEKVWRSVSLSRGLFGYKRDDARLEQILKTLSIWDKRDNKVQTLSGGMKRRVMIAKALSHEPVILFLDEPSAGVDVALRREMWQMVRELRRTGVTIILTTHYIEEAEEMADRIGVINKGEIILVEEKETLMRKLGKKTLTLLLSAKMGEIPSHLRSDQLSLSADGSKLSYTFDTRAEHTGVAEILRKVAESGVEFSDLETKQSSLEDIFLGLVGSAS